MTKATYIVTDQEHVTTKYSKDMTAVEYKNESDALKEAKRSLGTGDGGNEIWVWKLSHIVAMPDVEPDVEYVK